MARAAAPRSNPLVAAAFFLLVALAWEFGVRWFEVKPYLLPSLSAIATAFWDARGLLLEHGLVTLGEVLAGFIAAALLGVLLAAAIHVVPIARSTLYPMVIALQSIPKIGLAPLMVVWLGYGFGSKLVMAFLFAFFPIVIATLGGLAGVPSNLEEHFRALGASRWTMFRRLQVPAAMPNFMDGCKVAMPLAVIGAIVGEFVGSNNGLGNVILTATGSSQTALTFAALLAVTLLSLALFYVVELLSKFIWWRAI
ncbi:NitT/TauT family transport system permease protein [Sphingomonas laterariae]|uniref:NitT/TauT family transport system permease protein n=1 Tax=Edaphosphingomonas laterariae TaxID=861865 RepID=A0A239CWC0_9SPHN|nr:ABC transporter permease [Sphingomonas laterariae]SNS24209.1 NitT/TauT family transport system permease protein [Sphingomonas laterariae]